MSAIEQLRLDVAELTQLQEQATRPKVKDILGLEVRKLQTDLARRLEAEGAATDGVNSSGDAPAPKPRPVGRPVRDVKNYAWDQSDKFMKIYATDLSGIQQLPKESVTAEFTDSSFKLLITDFQGKDHKLHVAHLFDKIEPSASYHKVKSDMVTVFLKKSTEKKTWAFVTEQEKKAKEKKKPPMDADGAAAEKDPSSGLMDLMKQMYDDGDDEMKRTIAKAWTESQDKRSNTEPLGQE